MTLYLAPNEVVAIHDDAVVRFGGTLGVRDEGLLQSAVFRPQSSYGGGDLYQTVFDKAAALFHGIIFDHPFVDGNKRAAILGAGAFIVRNGWMFDATDEEVVAFPLFVEAERPEISEIAKWFKEHSRRTQKKGRTYDKKKKR